MTGDSDKCLFGEQFVPAWGLKAGPAGKQPAMILDKTTCTFRRPQSWPVEEGSDGTDMSVEVPCFVFNKLCEAKVINPKPEDKTDEPMGVAGAADADADYVPLYELLGLGFGF